MLKQNKYNNFKYQLKQILKTKPKERDKESPGRKRKIDDDQKKREGKKDKLE